MEEKTLAEQIMELLPIKAQKISVFDQVEERVAFVSLLEAIKATHPDIIEKYKEIFKQKSDEVLAQVKEMDFTKFE